MSDHTYSKPFYDLNEVKEYFLATKDLSFKKDIDKAIISLIHTNRLVPYVKYKGLVDIAVESREMSKEAKKEIIDALSHTIETEMSKLEIGELISPLDYDSTTNINDIIYLVKKLLFSLNGRQATRTYGKQPYVEGIFRLEPINVMHTYAGIKINLGLGMFLSQAIQLELNELEFSEDDFDGYVLYPSHYSGNDKIELEYQCELIFSSHDLEYILTVINRSHELPNLHNSLKNANRIISQKNKEIETLRKQLEKSQSKQDQYGTKGISPIEKTNLINSLFKGAGIAIADYLWEMDRDEQIKKNQMVQQLKSILFNIHSPLIPKNLQISKDDTINEWLTDIAPNYAKKGGRPKKDDNGDIILYMKK